MALQPYLRIVGKNDVIKALQALGRNTSGYGLRKALLLFGRYMHSSYLATVPVDTGLSRQDLTYRVKMYTPMKGFLWIGPRVKGASTGRQGKRPYDYLHFPDHGTRFIKAQRFAGKAFRRGSQNARGIINAYLQHCIRNSKRP